jgi:death-on-curing protein
MSFKRLTVDNVVRLHGELEMIHRTSGDPIVPPGVKDHQNLERAVARPWTTVGGEEAFRSLEEKAALLVWCLVCYHPFHNGNKRTAIAALREFLELNDRSLVVTNQKLIQLSELAVASCKDRSDEPYYHLSTWIAEHSTERFSVRQRRWKDVRTDLRRFGITGIPDRGFIHLKRETGPSLTVPFRGDTTPAGHAALRTIRTFFAL